jgi:O-antigen ligase
MSHQGPVFVNPAALAATASRRPPTAEAQRGVLPRPEVRRIPPSLCPIGFGLFILVNAVLFIRPQDLFPELLPDRTYQILILACAVVSFPALFQRLRPGSWASQPITWCVLGMYPAVIVSHLVHAQYGVAFEAATEFVKVILYFLLVISLLHSFARLRTFSLCLVAFVVILTSLALLHYHGVIEIPKLTELEEKNVDADTEELVDIVRLRSTGMYNDPNDLCLILCVGMAFTAYWLTDRATGPFRFVWLGPLLLFGYALALTQSRGGLLAMLAGMVVLFTSRFGWRKTIPLAALLIPAMLFFFSGRQTAFDLANTEDTAQARMQLWKEGFQLFKSAPLFGIGHKEYSEEVGLVAHNSFIHCFAELGVFGGTMFTGAFFLSAWSLYRLRRTASRPDDDRVARLRSYLLTAVVTYIVGMLSLSRAYIEPTYLVSGLAAAYVALPGLDRDNRLPRVSPKLMALVVGVSLAGLAALYAWVKIFAA